ncbi:MAG: disulfide bond formation protein B, partial [Legionella sp.]
MNKINYVRIHSFLTLITVIVLLTSLYLQYFVKLQPCPLCLMQRFCVFLLLIIMGLSFHTLKRAHLLSILQVIISAAGMF